MKYLSLLLLCLLPLALTAQYVEYRGNVPTYNTTVQLFSHKSAASNLFFTDVTGDTMTYWVDISQASNIAVHIKSDDSASVHVYYRLRGTLNQRKGWTLLDSINQFTDNATQATRLSTTLSTANLLGYDRIQFYVLYKYRCTQNVSKTIRLYMTATKLSGGPLFNPAIGTEGLTQVPYLAYYKAGYTASTANETTKSFINITGSRAGVAVVGRADDSIRAVIYYQLKNAVTGSTFGWCALDTMNGADETAGQDTVIGTLPADSLVGWDQMKIYVDQIAGSTSGTVTRYLRVYLNFLRRE